MYLEPDALECLATIFNNAAACNTMPSSSNNSNNNDNNNHHHQSEQNSTTIPEYSDTILQFANAVLLQVSSNNEVAKNAALHSIAIFATSSYHAFTLLLNNNDIINNWTSMMKSPKPSLRAAVLMSAAHIIGSDIHMNASLANSTVFQTTTAAASASMPTEDTEIIKGLKVKLLIAIGKARDTPVVTYILKLAKEPIPETMQAACRVLCALGKSSWGLNLLFSGENSHVGSHMWAYIHDYHMLSTKEQKEWKYDVICSIANSPGFTHLRIDLQTLISKRVEQGPYFVAAEVAGPMVL